MTTRSGRTIVDGIDLVAALPAIGILRAVAMAMQPSMLVLGLLMVSAVMTGGRLWDRFTEPGVSPAGLLAGPATAADRERARTIAQTLLERLAPDPSSELDVDLTFDDLLELYHSRRSTPVDGEVDQQEASDRQALRDLDDARLRGTFEATVRHASTAFNRMVRSVTQLRPVEALDASGDLLVRTPIALWRCDKLFCLIFGSLTALVLALGGGAISRLAAVQWAGQTRARLGHGVDFAIGRLGALVGALLLPIVMAAVAALVVGLLGLLLRLPGLDIVGGLLYGAAIVLGVVIALLLVGYLGGAALLVPAVACEGCDAADAQQRAYAYVMNRPLHLVGYGLVAVVGLAIGYLVVSLVLVVALNAVAALIAAAGGNHPALAEAGGFAILALEPGGAGGGGGGGLVPPPAGTARATAVLIRFWQTVAVSLAPAYVLSYLFAAATIVYLLLRRACDGQDFTEIWPIGAAAAPPHGSPNQDHE